LIEASPSAGIDLGFDGDEPVLVRGERLLLREPIANVVHNAIVSTTRARPCDGQ
jgi:two-component system, OmpR family, sensor histidine kinase TctE